MKRMIVNIYQVNWQFNFVPPVEKQLVELTNLPPFRSSCYLNGLDILTFSWTTHHRCHFHLHFHHHHH